MPNIIHQAHLIILLLWFLLQLLNLSTGQLLAKPYLPSTSNYSLDWRVASVHKMLVTQAWVQILSTYTEVWAHSICTHLTHIQLTERSLFLIHSHVTCHTAYYCPSEILLSHNAVASARICCAYCLAMGWIRNYHMYGNPSLTGQVKKKNTVICSGLPCHHHSSHLSHGCANYGKMYVASHKLDSGQHMYNLCLSSKTHSSILSLVIGQFLIQARELTPWRNASPVLGKLPD